MASAVSDTEPTLKLSSAVKRGGEQTAAVGVHANQRLSLADGREGSLKKGQGFKPDLGNPAVRDYRGASGNVAMVEL